MPVAIGNVVRLLSAISLLFCAAPALAFTPDDPARILYVGDSLAANTAARVVAETQTGDGLAVTFHTAFPGMAICDFLEHPDAEMPRDDRLTARLRRSRPHLVILQFWGNAFTRCMDGAPTNSIPYYRRYFDDAQRAVRLIEETAVELNIVRPRILWVLQGPDPHVPGRTVLLNAIYRWTAAAHGDRTTDAGATLSAAADPDVHAPNARELWVRDLPCSDDERGTPYCTHPEADGGRAQLHRDDDPIHFCLGNHKYFFKCDRPSPAIRRYGRVIANDAKLWLGIDLAR